MKINVVRLHLPLSFLCPHTNYSVLAKENVGGAAQEEKRSLEAVSKGNISSKVASFYRVSRKSTKKMLGIGKWKKLDSIDKPDSEKKEPVV